MGPAGKLLDELIKRAVPQHLRLAFTNMVGCQPRNPDGDKRPTEEQVQQCRPRLEEFLRDVARPKAIVCLGKIPKDFLTQGYKWSVKVDRSIPQCHLMPPSAILQADQTRQQLLALEQVHALTDFLEEHFPSGEDR